MNLYYGSVNDVPLKTGAEKIEVPSLSKTLEDSMLFSHIPECYKKFIAEREKQGEAEREGERERKRNNTLS